MLGYVRAGDAKSVGHLLLRRPKRIAVNTQIDLDAVTCLVNQKAVPGIQILGEFDRATLDSG